MATDYKELVVQAEKAVASVSDPALKQIAFQKVLDDLLTGSKPHAQAKSSLKPKTTPSPSAKRAKKGPRAYIEALIQDGFFSSKKSLVDVQAELADRGHHIKTSDVGVVLLRLCKARVLRRKKEGKAYLYSNW